MRLKVAVMRILVYSSKEFLGRVLEIGGAKKIAIRAASEPKCDVCLENKPAKNT